MGRPLGNSMMGVSTGWSGSASSQTNFSMRWWRKTTISNHAALPQGTFALPFQLAWSYRASLCSMETANQGAWLTT